MRVFVSADSHFGHANIQTYEPGRQVWSDVQAMNEMLIHRWNETVEWDDIVFFLGDFAMGRIADSLPIAKRLNGRKVLTVGNHDRPFGMKPQDPGNLSDSREKRWKSKAKHARWYQEYLDAGFEIIADEIEMTFDGVPIRMCHFPYGGDHDDENIRYSHLRPVDDGTLLIHGHVHSAWETRLSDRGTPMVNAGLDVNDYRPILLADAINRAMPF